MESLYPVLPTFHSESIMSAVLEPLSGDWEVKLRTVVPQLGTPSLPLAQLTQILIDDFPFGNSIVPNNQVCVLSIQ